ncbi:hypothetical protein [Nocardia brasiliensis]|uniref:DUF8020 domain-containing protein n=1 Tax=Nocardia brasiliensis (strain ATCC 700358 / HUJEG-1) TaxID=1133849 RepID=K0F5E4_NOCB7|nr:hypothetical protein [Nocardia brasiliensis]AFU04550.1 hypothetical protein O3I_033005 [Nocardia brasiliensis ATCC 700358]OCF85775.1 hypothetical protein AW168_35155 [Nocardia brasiliensis]
MLMRNLAATATMLIAALGVAAGTAAADPAAADAPINFTAESTDTQAIVSLDAGSIVVEDGALKIKAANGNVVAGTPLKFRLDEFEFPIAADIAGRTATLTPQLDMSKAVYKPVALPFEDKAPWKSEYDREQAAWSRMTGTISLGASIATLVGGLGGAAAMGALGTVAGQIFITAPVAIGAAIQYFTTINQPFNPAK